MSGMSKASDIIGRAGGPFGLSARALKFAKEYAAHPHLSATVCATRAGYSDEGRAAHVRASELLRDARVQRAVIHYGTVALAKAQAAAANRLALVAGGGPVLSMQDRLALKYLRIDMSDVAARYARLAQTMDRAEAA